MLLYSERDVAQLVARLVWDQDVAGSNPVIPTKDRRWASVHRRSFVWLYRFEARKRSLHSRASGQRRQKTGFGARIGSKSCHSDQRSGDGFFHPRIFYRSLTWFDWRLSRLAHKNTIIFKNLLFWRGFSVKRPCFCCFYTKIGGKILYYK